MPAKKVKRWVRSKDGQALQVDAYILPNVKGIFANQDPRNELWCVTHRGSGFRVGENAFFKSRKMALKFLAGLGAFDVDWTIKDEQEVVSAHPGLGKQVRDLARQLKN